MLKVKKQGYHYLLFRYFRLLSTLRALLLPSVLYSLPSFKVVLVVAQVAKGRGGWMFKDALLTTPCRPLRKQVSRLFLDETFYRIETFHQKHKFTIPQHFRQVSSTVAKDRGLYKLRNSSSVKRVLPAL